MKKKEEIPLIDSVDNNLLDALPCHIWQKFDPNYYDMMLDNNGVQMVDSFASSNQLPVFLRVRIPSLSSYAKLSVLDWIDKLEEKSCNSDGRIEEDIIGAKFILRSQCRSSNTYHLLELMVKKANRILKILEQHKLEVYELPVWCLNECMSKVVLHWLRTCDFIESGKYQRWNLTQGISLDLILTYYGIVQPLYSPDEVFDNMKNRIRTIHLSQCHHKEDIGEEKIDWSCYAKINAKSKQRQRAEKYLDSMDNKKNRDRRQRSRNHIVARRQPRFRLPM